MIAVCLLLTAVFCSIVHIFLQIWKSMNYWKVRGVPYIKSLPFLGNFLSVIKLKSNANGLYVQAYNEFPDAPMVGVHELMTNTLVLRDPGLIQEVLVGDFSNYPDHGSFVFEPSSVMYDGLFLLQGNRWRALRNRLLLTFTSGRMKTMFPALLHSCQSLINSQPTTLDRWLLSDFAIDSFLKSIFGMSFDPASQDDFRQNVRKIFMINTPRFFRHTLLTYFPRFADFFSVQFISKKVDMYFRTVINSILEKRFSEDKIVREHRKDFTQVLCDLKENGKMHIFNKDNNEVEETFEVTNDLVVSQGFMFFFAGMDTTSLVMLYTAFELAQHPDVQQKARQEVTEVLQKHREYTYEAVKDMKYLDACIQESLRLHPSLTFLMRVAANKCTLGGTTLDKGTRIIVPLWCLQMDPSHYPQPAEFQPQRWLPGNTSNTGFTYLPFSDGPRVCLGKRFSMLEITLLFALLLENFELTLNPNTKLPVEYDKKSLFLTPQNNIYINLNKI